ncbi:BCCT family transporter [Streptomyces sp. NPDC053542]|uniref:BCCT family transporter n=1 Tax=Streptomyces sp. NPDC053542 TaxID=3365710 RepID=UPI0037CDBF85
MTDRENEPGGGSGPTAAIDLPPESHSARPAQTDRVVFGVTALLTLAFIVWGATSTKSLENASNTMLDWLIKNGGWAFVLAASAFVIFAIWLAISKYGRITLGAEGEEPEFRTVSWIAMMFSAGMGIGLMFYGVSEPLGHFSTHPPGTHPRDAAQAMDTAMATTLFHWTLHPWAIYAVVGLGIAYSTFRRGRRQTISAVFTPLIGARRANGAGGRLIDILAIFATLFGSAASLGLGALQIGSGIKVLGWKDSVSTTLLVVIITVLTIAFILSAVSGIAKGIQWLSNINMVLALILAVFVFIAGPTILILNMVPTGVATFFGELSQMAGRTGASSGEDVDAWLRSWTVFYWAWWISWTPFVGMFIARISRGRTIRQFVGGVILVPSVVSLIWFAIFGQSAMFLKEHKKLSDTASVEGALFDVLHQYPVATLMSVLVMILVGIFFVSGADAASIVMGTLSQKGTMEPTKPVVIFWGVVTGAVAAIMLLIGGGSGDALTGLQNLTILVAAPFTLVMIMMCWALLKDLRSDPLIVRGQIGEEVIEAAVVAGHEKYEGDFEIRIGPSNGGSAEETTIVSDKDGPAPAGTGKD